MDSTESFYTVLDGGAFEYPKDTPSDSYYETEKLTDVIVQLEFLHKQFDPKQWLKFFHEYTSKEFLTQVSGGFRTQVHHSIRKIIQLYTWEYIEQGRYPLPSGKIVQFDTTKLKDWVCQTKQYSKAPSFTEEELSTFPTYDTKFLVIEGDCLEVAHYLHDQNYNPLVLNMANATTPGGGYRYGAGAQEENLFRRSNYYQSLEDPHRIQGKKPKIQYPIATEGGAIYSPKIVVFRAAESKGYAFLEKPTTFSFIAVPALSRPQLKRTADGDKFTRSARDTTLNKVKTIFAVALQNGHDSLVLSALGCGAFRNPPREVAAIFKEVAQSDTFKGKFKVVAFGIFNDHNARGEGNVKPFADAFGVEPSKL